MQKKSQVKFMQYFELSYYISTLILLKKDLEILARYVR